MKKILLIILMLIFVIGMSGTVLAVPGVPHQFYGEATINGEPAPDGTKVTATVDGVTRGEATTVDGEYDMLVKDPNNVYGTYNSEIKFYVKAKNTGESDAFVAGGSTSLDLDVTISSDTGSDAGGDSGDSGSSGGGGSIGTESSDDLWDCGEWSDCVKGEQTQECFMGIVSVVNTRDCNEKDLIPGTTTLIPPTPPGFDDDSEGAEDDLLSGPGAPPITGSAIVEDDENSSFVENLTKGWLVPVLLIAIVALLVVVLVMTGRTRRKVKEVIVKDKPVKPVESKRIDPPVADEPVSKPDEPVQHEPKQDNDMQKINW